MQNLLKMKSNWSSLQSCTVIAPGSENITNKHYRPYFSSIAATGSNFIFSVRRSLLL
jgi:hypothetical protein